MLGELIFKIRTSKNITKATLSHETGVDAGHISHIEKGERTPSHKVLKKIASVLDVPYQQLMYTYDKELSEEAKNYKLTSHIAYNSIPAVSSIEDLIICPTKFGSASIALAIDDTSMEPSLLQGTYAYVEFNSPLNNKDIGLFYYNNKLLIRRFIIRKSSLLLKADNNSFPDIKLSENDNFYIVGKILGTNDDF